MGIFYGCDHFESLSLDLILFFSGCQKDVPVFKRFFSTTTYTAIPYFGTSFWKAV